MKRKKAAKAAKLGLGVILLGKLADKLALNLQDEFSGRAERDRLNHVGLGALLLMLYGSASMLLGKKKLDKHGY